MSVRSNHQPNVHPLVGLRTPLGQIPREWLETVEPKLVRPPGTSCWLWTGDLNKEGEPVVTRKNLLTGKRVKVLVKKIVLSLFWKPQKWWEVVHGCETTNCLNPRHFYVSNVNWRQEDRVAIIKRMAVRIRRWGKDHE